MSSYTADRIREDVVSWIADQLDAEPRRQDAERSNQSTRHREPRGIRGRVRGLFGGSGRETHPAQGRKVDRPEARRQAKKQQDKALAKISEVGAESREKELARKLCELLGVPSAATFTNAWIDGDRPNEGGDHVEEGELEWVIGVAAAVIVVVIVTLVRRGTEFKAHHRRWAPSSDFKLIIDLSKESGQAGDVARRIQSCVQEPWSWSLVEGAKHLDADERRTLLARLSRDSVVNSIAPAIGERFDYRTMNTADEPSDDNVWVVIEVTEQGFIFHGQTLYKAQVVVATLDSRVLLDKECPVGSFLGDHADELIPGGSAGAATWRATWGLSHPEDLRKRFNEQELDTWRQRMMRELNKAYEHKGQRQLALTGQPGAIFELSTMDLEGAPPVGDAIVSEVVARDGVTQYGLACPGGSALLLAIVRVNPPENA